MKTMRIVINLADKGSPNAPDAKSHHGSLHESIHESAHVSLNNGDGGKTTAESPGASQKLEETVLLLPAVITHYPAGGQETAEHLIYYCTTLGEISRRIMSGREKVRPAYGNR